MFYPYHILAQEVAGQRGELEYDLRVVPDGQAGTEDGMGFIPRELAKRLSGQLSQLQVRLAGRDWLARGALLPYSGNEIIIPNSMVKWGSPASGPHIFLG